MKLLELPVYWTPSTSAVKSTGRKGATTFGGVRRCPDFVDRSARDDTEEGLSRNRDQDLSSEASLQFRDSLQDGNRGLRVVSEKESHAGVDDQPVLGDARADQFVETFVKKAIDRCEDLVRCRLVAGRALAFE